MRVYAFQGFRYGAGAGQTGDHAAPPFDQIGDELRDRLHADPLHFSWLTRPAAAAGEDPHAHAAALHRRWLVGGIVGRDESPALYPYEIRLAAGGRRLGLCALIGIEPLAAGIIRPHEATLTKTVAERLHLLQCLPVDLEPIMLLADDGGALESLLASDMERLEPLVGHRDPAGDSHVLRRMSDPPRIRDYQHALAHAPGLIADGHHRYRVAQLHAERSGARPGTAPSCKLAVLTSLTSPALKIDPIHRGLPPTGGLQPAGDEVGGGGSSLLPRQGAPGAGHVDPAAAAPFVRNSTRWLGQGGAGLAAAVAAAPQPALGVWFAGEVPAIWHLDDARAAHHTSQAAARLPVVLLHSILFPALGLSDRAATDGTIVYRSDPEELYRQVASGVLAAGFWLPPLGGEAFAEAIADGGLLPPKSTRFMPKLVSGLVWAGHDAEVV